jgi:hypothetical protein
VASVGRAAGTMPPSCGRWDLRSIFTEDDDAALLESRVAGESLAREPGSASRGSASEKEACNHERIEERAW